MPAVKNRKIAQQHVPAILQSDSLIADAGLLRHRTRPMAPAQALPPDQAVMPVIVAKILIVLPRLIRLGGIVSAMLARCDGIGRQYRRAGSEMKRYMAF